jgi:hypothetical protein
MGNPHLKLVIPAAEKRTVMTRRGEEQRAAHARVAVKSRPGFSTRRDRSSRPTAMCSSITGNIGSIPTSSVGD